MQIVFSSQLWQSTCKTLDERRQAVMKVWRQGECALVCGNCDGWSYAMPLYINIRSWISKTKQQNA